MSDSASKKSEEKKSDVSQFPKSRLGWLWENMEGKRRLFIIALIGTVVYNIMQLVVPFFSGKIVDLLRDIQENEWDIADYKEEFLWLIAIMVGLTLIRVTIVYLDCMAYEHMSMYLRRLCTGSETSYMTRSSARI